MPRLVLLLIFSLCLLHHAGGQRLLPYTWEDFVTSMTEDEDEEEGDNRNEWIEELRLLHEHPLDINNAAPEALMQVPTLTEEAVEQIHAYIYLHGAIQTLGELRLIPGIDEEMLRVLPLFIRIQPQDNIQENKGKRKKRLRGSMDYRTDIPLYYRKGYCVSPGYAGDPLYHRYRGELEYADARMGFRMEKDPGETYYDSFGGFLMLERKGWMRRFVVGDFRAGFGQGLVIGSGSQWGISSHIISPSQGIRPMRGMDEYRFLRGVSAEMRLNTGKGALSLTPFLSWRKLDATLDEEGNVRTLRQDGLHRTQTERNAQRTVGHLAAGGHLGWKYRWLSLGTTAMWQQTDRPLQPGDALYRQIYPKGSRFGHMAMDYACSFYRLQISGEAAYSFERGGWATLHRIRWTPQQKLQLGLIPRFYSYRYHSMLSSAPTAYGSVPQNESGIMLHLSTQPVEGLSFTAYADASHHPWPRYGIQQESNIFRIQAEGEYAPSHAHRFWARYQWKHGLERGDVMRTHHQMRLQWEWRPRELHSLRISLMGHQTEKRIGWGLSGRWQLQSKDKQWAGTLSATYFDTYDYLHRIWIYEPSLIGSVSNGTFSGNGIRGAGKIRWKSRNEQWTLEAKIGATYRIDTRIQGSGLQTIMGRWKTDIGTLVRYSF